MIGLLLLVLWNFVTRAFCETFIVSGPEINERDDHPLAKISKDVFCVTDLTNSPLVWNYDLNHQNFHSTTFCKYLRKCWDIKNVI